MRLEGGSDLVLRVLDHTACLAKWVCELLSMPYIEGLRGEIVGCCVNSKKEAVGFRIGVALCVIPSRLTGC